MGWFKRNEDPISRRAKELEGEIASLEAKIKQMNSKLESAPAQPRTRSISPGQTPHAPPAEAARAGQPIFETVNHRLDPGAAAGGSSQHFNDLGVRKYDLAALLRRLQNQFQGPTANNPKLVSYLAAGSIKGLRPLRYEKRVARNRFIALFVVLLLFLWGIIALFFEH